MCARPIDAFGWCVAQLRLGPLVAANQCIVAAVAAGFDQRASVFA